MNFTALPLLPLPYSCGNETFANETFAENCTTTAVATQYVFGDAFTISLAVMAPVTFCAFCAYVFEDQRKKREKRRERRRIADGTPIEDLV